MKPERIDVAKAGERLDKLLESAEKNHHPVLLEEEGRVVGALVPIYMYRTLSGERTARAEAFRRAGESMPNYPEDEVERDIAEALAAVRHERRALDERDPGQR
jgi:PHD/YefM family antitoxin component YafN of YafNO toxin-antitoxin module